LAFKILTGDELRALEDVHPSILFHGTSSVYSDLIDANGWPLSRESRLINNLEFVRDLSYDLNCSTIKSAYLEVNLKSVNLGRGAYFTQILAGAIEYAEYTGGELVRVGHRRCIEVIRYLEQNYPERGDDLMRVQGIRTELKQRMTSSPIVYAIRAQPGWFDNLEVAEDHFAFQRKEHGKILFKEGNVYASVGLPASCIIGKAAIGNPTPIENS